MENPNFKQTLARKFGKRIGTAVTAKVSSLATATATATAPPQKPTNNNGKKVLPAFIGGFKGQVLSQAALRNYAKLARRVTGAPLHSEKNFLNLLEALTNEKNSGEHLGRRMGAPTRRLIQNVVLPRFEGPAPPPNPVVNGFINELRDINFSRTVKHLSPLYANNLNIIVKRAINISRPKRPINVKRENSRRLGVALAHIINDRLGKIHPAQGPGQPSREGAIIGGFFQGLFSQNKTGLATWSSKYFGNRLGNRNLNPELKSIIMKFLRNPENANSQQTFLQSIIRLYQKFPNSKILGCKNFRSGLISLVSIAQSPMARHVIKTAMQGMGGTKTTTQLAQRALMSIPAVQRAAVQSARTVRNAAYRGIAEYGRRIKKNGA
jgi:hypothetical protein